MTLNICLKRRKKTQADYKQTINSGNVNLSLEEMDDLNTVVLFQQANLHLGG